MWQAQVADHEFHSPPKPASRDFGKWLLLIGYALVAAVVLAGLSFAAGYLTGVHVFANLVHQDNAALIRLRLENQLLHQKLAQSH